MNSEQKKEVAVLAVIGVIGLMIGLTIHLTSPIIPPKEVKHEIKPVQKEVIPPMRMLTVWYGGKHYQGRWTAAGIRKSKQIPEDLWRFDENKLTCAHRTLAFGTILRLTYKSKSVEVMVTDRGPLLETGRDIDITKEAARQLGIQRIGVAETEAVEVGKWKS